MSAYTSASREKKISKFVFSNSIQQISSPLTISSIIIIVFIIQFFVAFVSADKTTASANRTWHKQNCFFVSFFLFEHFIHQLFVCCKILWVCKLFSWGFLWTFSTTKVEKLCPFATNIKIIITRRFVQISTMHIVNKNKLPIFLFSRKTVRSFWKL